VLGALKGKYRSICRDEMSQRVDKRDEGRFRGAPGVGLRVGVGRGTAAIHHVWDF
jgi:hypothetical protein